MALVCNRYAKALFDIAVLEKSLDKYKEELETVSNAFTSEKNFKTFLLDPKQNRADKKQVVQNIFKNYVGINTLNFIKLLIDKNRVQFIPEICEEFIRLSDIEQNILNITVISSLPLQQEHITQICEKYQRLYKAGGVKVKAQIDSSLMGGLKVAIGDKLYDASMKDKIAELRSAMMI